MKVLGLLLSKQSEIELNNKFEDKMDFIDNFSDFFDEIKDVKPEIIVVDGDSLKTDKLVEVIERITSINKKTIIFIIGERSNMKIVASCIKAGAYDYLLKPINTDLLFNKIEKAKKDLRLKAEKIENINGFSDDEYLLGNTSAMVDIYKLIGKVSNSNVPLLINGEKGTGKELIAKAIHNFSDRQEMNFINVNCSALQRQIIDKKFFGSEQEISKDNKIIYKGFLEEANNGTLFLKEIADLPLDMQGKILAVLQGTKFNRIGSNFTINSDIRIIASTSKNLEELVNEGKFRDDLYHKLKIIEMQVPPLRERKDDIPILVDHFIKKINLEIGRSIKGISKPALNKIIKHDWPGNIKELKNTLKSAIALCRGSSILVEDLPLAIIGRKNSKSQGELHDIILSDWVAEEINVLKKNNQTNYYCNVINRVERELIKQVLESTQGKKVESAEILGITRNTLRSKMNNYGLE